MHDTVRGASLGGTDGYIYEVHIFNSSSDVTEASRLRLINPGALVAGAGLKSADLRKPAQRNRRDR